VNLGLIKKVIRAMNSRHSNEESKEEAKTWRSATKAQASNEETKEETKTQASNEEIKF
jgi:hypothetical protein